MAQSSQASSLKIGINGLGRIGRVILRKALDRLNIVGVNDLGGLDAAAHLLKYDSTHGRWDREISIIPDKGLEINGQKILFSAERDPQKIPWAEWGVDIVLECTGVFKTAEDVKKHLSSGAKKVIVSAPFAPADTTFVFGVNHQEYDSRSHHIISNASCTTNCLAPVVKVIDKTFGIEQGMMTTIHSYTNDQKILDAHHKDLRRARAGALSMIPTSTGAAKAVTKVLPHLEGKIDGVAVRVPTPNVSLVDFVVSTQKSLTVKEVNSALMEASRGSLKGVLACTDQPLVSVDFNGSPYSSIVDLASTLCLGQNMVKTFAWYDNESGFSHRMIDLTLFIAERL